MKVSIRDISAMTGYSPATVSNALNHKKGVNKETAARIFQIAKEVGYISELTITKIKLVVFRKNGLIVEDTPFFPSLIYGFEQECRLLGYEMVLYNVDARDSDYEKQVNSLIREEGSAIVILATEMVDEDLEIYKKASCPIVILDYWIDSMEFNAVLINNTDAARQATEYLIKKGHREIGYIRGSFRINAFRSRAAGFQSALRRHSLKCKENHVFTVQTTLNGAYQDMLGYLKKTSELPTAFFADNDLIALGAMQAFQEQGYRIPEDISIVGFDDLQFSEISAPPLSTINVPKTEMGKITVRRLVELIEKRDSVITKTQVCTRFVERDSVKDLTK